MTRRRRRVVPLILLFVVSLGTAATIEACYECFGLDGDPIHLVRALELGLLAMLCAGVALTLVFERLSRCPDANARAYFQRDILDRLPCGGTGVGFTVFVAVLQSLCMAAIQMGDSIPNAGEDVAGWTISSLFVVIGTLIVRSLLRLVPRLAAAIVALFLRIFALKIVFRPSFESRPIGGCARIPRVMFKRPPPRPLHA